MGDKETVSDYIARAHGIATKCASLELQVTPRELAYYTVRGINNQYKDMREILKTQRDKTIEEIQEVLKERENEVMRRDSYRKDTEGAAYSNSKGCYECGRMRHMAKSCWYRRNEKHARQHEHNQNRGKPSGASNHMVNELKWFIGIDFQIGELSQAGENSELRYEGVGTVKMKVRQDANKDVTIIMNDVLYVPKLREKLLSTTTFMSKGYTIVQKGNMITVYDQQGNQVICGELNDKRVKFLANACVDMKSEPLSYNVERTTNNSFRIWCKCLGHVNNEYLTKMYEEEMVEGIRKLPFDENFVCDSCNLGKLNWKPHKIITRNQSKSPLELLHADICGPMPIPSLSGSRYMMIFVDDYSGSSRDRRGYRIYDPEIKQVIEERSVKFNELDLGRVVPNDETEIGLDREETTDEYADVNEIAENNSGQDIEEFSTDRLDRGTDCGNVNVSGTRDRPKGSTREVIEFKSNLRRIEERRKDEQENLRRSERIRNRNQEVVNKTSNERIVKSKWVFTLKNNDKQNIRFKARLVATGYNQIKYRDYNESYSPMIPIEAWRLMMCVAVKLNWHFRLFDVKAAYLHGDIKETVYLSLLPEFEKGHGEGEVLKLKRSIYGLPQSGRNWYINFKNTLLGIGFKQLMSENCIFFLRQDNDDIVMAIYVDDFTIFYNNKGVCNSIVSRLKESYEITETTDTNVFLNIKIERFKTGIGLSQAKYNEKLLVKHNMNDCNIVTTPIVPGEDKAFEPTKDSIEQGMYQELIGELLYLSSRTRPDIAFVVSYLSQYNSRLEKRHLVLVKKVLRYLCGTKDKPLFYGTTHGVLKGYADAS
ncbi:uncharacterized protein LOC143341213 [Colletes latitarsis]|uniref:uncharacterized protein LOC143341213 n=1 Tax=Colletes latitarsis TaxID=2605962 RepID=UPI0040366F8D